MLVNNRVFRRVWTSKGLSKGLFLPGKGRHESDLPLNDVRELLRFTRSLTAFSGEALFTAFADDALRGWQFDLEIKGDQLTTTCLLEGMSMSCCVRAMPMLNFISVNGN